MSLIVAVRDDVDVVIASDGRVLAENQAVISDDSLKTIALNREVCVGIAGYTDSMREVLRSLGMNCRRSHPIDLLSACQAMDCPIDVEYADAHKEVSGVLRWMIRHTSPHQRERVLPSVVLAGRWQGHPALCSWNAPTWRPLPSPSSGFSDVAVGMLPEDGSQEREKFGQLVRGERTTDQAEARLTRAVRFCALHFGDRGPVSSTVFLRRMSEGFMLSRNE